MDLYIYYRVRCEDADRFGMRVAGMQQDLARDCGVSVSLKRRPEASDGRHTWMEIYCGVPEGFEHRLAEAVAACELKTLIDGERHLEYFMDVTACA